MLANRRILGVICGGVWPPAGLWEPLDSSAVLLFICALFSLLLVLAKCYTVVKFLLRVELSLGF